MALLLDAFWWALKRDTEIFTHCSHSHVSMHKPRHQQRPVSDLPVFLPGPRPTSQATKNHLGICMYILTSCHFSLCSRWSARRITCSSAHKEFPSSLSFKVTLGCGYNAALSVFILFPCTKTTQRWSKFRLLRPPSANHMRPSLQSQMWAGRWLLLQL